MRFRACLAVAVLVLALPAFGVDTGISVGGQVLGSPKEARAVLLPILSEIEAGRLELDGKAYPEPVASVAVAADGSFRLEVPGPGMWKVVVEAPGFVPREILLAPLVEETELQAVELEKDARLEVRLRGPDGRPVAGARVRAVSVGSPSGKQDKWRRPVGTALTDSQGLAVLPRGSAEALTVRAGMAGLPSVEKRDVRTSSLSLSLSGGQTRELRVLDSRGKPVAGALVRLGEARWAGGLTSEEGLFSVPLAGNQKVRVSASAGDGRSSSAYLEPAKPTETGPRELRLPAVEALAGRVVSTLDGRPVVGALVWAGDLGTFQRTSGDGGYKLPGVVGRELAVQAAAASFFQARESWPVRPGERRAPTLALEPAQSASGIVVDEQGKPVAGVEIQAKIQPGSRIRTPGRWGSGGNARTTAAGRFRIPGLAAGIAHELQLAKRGYAPARADAPPAAPGKVAAELRIVLRRGRTAFGRVINHAEQPVAGAKVNLEADDSGPGHFFRDEIETFDATADAGGRFEVPDLSPGAYKLTARGAGYAPITVPGLTVPEGGGATDLGTVVLVKGVALEGYVADLAGKPLEGAQVFVFEASSDPALSFHRKEEPPAAISEKDGFFRVEDRRAGETVDLEVRRSGYARGEAPRVEVPPQEPVRIALKPSSVVEGRTADPDGKPVAGALVLLNPAGPSKVGRGVIFFTSANSKEVHSGDDGSVRIEDVAPGTYELKSFASGRQSAEMSNLEVVVGQDLKGVEVVLQPGAVIEGRVLSQEGRPIAGAQIQLVEPEPGISRMIIRPIQARSDGDGYYRLDGIAPGDRTFAADREGFRPAVRELEVRAGQNSLDFRLEAGLEVAGRVVDDAGTPVSAARVELREGFNSWELPGAVSGPDGSFTLSGVSDGTYRIAAEKRGYAGSEEGQELTVAGSSLSGVEVKLSTGGAIVGQLSGLDFTELSQVQVWADHEWHPGRVSPDGTYRIENVEPGDRRIVASVRGARQTEGRVTLEAGVREIRLDLEFTEGHVLTGRVTRNREMAQGQALSLDGPGVTGRWAETDHEGRFRFEGLESGTYTLTVLNRRGQVHRKESVELTRDRELIIELVTATVTGRVVDSSDKSALSGVQVLVSPPEAAESKVFSLELTASTDSRGEFRVPDVPEGSWRVRALLAGYGPGEESIEIDSNSAPDELEIPLQATEGVTLEVVLASGRPPDSVQAAVLDATGRVVASAFYPTGENGKVRIASVAPGTWELILNANGSAPIAVPVTAPGNAGRVVLPLAGGLSVKVPGLVGARTDAKATLIDANGKPLRYPWREARAEHDLDAGSLKLEHVAAGMWSVSVTASDGRKWSGTATVVPGTTSEVTLE